MAGSPAPLLSERSCTRREALELTSDCVEASSFDPSWSSGDNNEMRKEERRSKWSGAEVRGEDGGERGIGEGSPEREALRRHVACGSGGETERRKTA